MKKRTRDIEKTLAPAKFAATLRRVADAVEAGEKIRIQVSGERLNIPADALFSIEHERGEGIEEVELRIRWKTR